MALLLRVGLRASTCFAVAGRTLRRGAPSYTGRQVRLACPPPPWAASGAASLGTAVRVHPGVASAARGQPGVAAGDSPEMKAEGRAAAACDSDEDDSDDSDEEEDAPGEADKAEFSKYRTTFALLVQRLQLLVRSPSNCSERLLEQQ